jgi:outer membrane lipoprotein-sorting protein
MKKKIVILFSAFLVLLLVGCSGENNSQTTTEEIDTNLTGIELLESLKLEIPESLIMETETIGVEGMNSKSKTCLKGDNMRMEIESPELGKNITIYNANEGKTYQYQDGESTGYVFLDSETDDDEIDESEMMPSYADVIDETVSQDIIARNEVLDGEDVIYIETTEVDESGNIESSMWLSKKYGTMLKYELVQNGEVIMSSKVTHIEANVNIDDALFNPPANVEFVDVSMDNLFDGMDDLENIE